MGVRGLTTYIATHADRYLMPYELKNCMLVIDGNSLVALLYNWYSNCTSFLGGDYDKYAKCVSTFFLTLRKCNVTPLVIFDGGYESKKLRTVVSRLRKKIRLAKHISPTSKDQFFPLLLKDVFKDVLLGLGIPFAQCLFEADYEIAAIARVLNCPVLSYDSDFFVYDVMYIPFSTVHIDVSKRKNSSNEGTGTEFFLNCNIYLLENFLNHFGGLHKSLIPLMATLLGNDYISRSVFKNFFASYLKLPKIRSVGNSQKFITALLQWMKTETIETATRKVLSTFKLKRRRAVKYKMKLTIKGYTQCSSDLFPYLGLSTASTLNLQPTQDVGLLHFEDCAKTEPSEASISQSTVSNPYEGEDSSESLAESVDSECCSSKSASVCGSQEDKNSEYDDVNDEYGDEFVDVSSSMMAGNLPEWFKENFLRGLLPPFFMDMIERNTYFCSPQVEDYTCPFAHEISFPIIYVMNGLLKGDGNTVPEEPLICYGRNSNHQPQNFRLTEEMIKTKFFSHPFPTLATLYDLPLERRKSVLFDALGFTLEDCTAFSSLPGNWLIFIFAVVFWGRHCTQPLISNCHVHALLLGIIALNVVDEHAGYYRSKQTFSRAQGSKLVKMKEMRKIKRRSSTRKCDGLRTNEYLVEVNVSNQLATVTTEECILANEALLSFHVMNDRLKKNPKLYSLTTVHAFAQFQSCLFHIMSLNCLLNFPFPQCRVANLYSGTFAHNAYSSFKKCADVDALIESTLKCRSTVHNLYMSLYHAMQTLLPGLLILRKKKKHRSTKVKRAECLETDDEPSPLSDLNVEDELYEDSNNKFSLLGLIARTEGSCQ